MVTPDPGVIEVNVHPTANWPDLVAVTDDTWAQMETLVQSLSLPALLQGQQRLRESEVQVKSTTQPRLWLEITLMGLLPSSLQSPAVAAPSIPTPRDSSEVSSSPPMAPVSAPPSPAPSAPPVASAPVPSPPVLPPASPPAASPPATPLPQAVPTPAARSAAVPPPKAPSPPPSPTPVPEPAAASASSTVIPPTVNLGQVWRDVLQHLRPPGTQALLEQHGQLLSLEGTRAKVGVVSAPLMKMAEQRVKNLEAAFEAALNAQVSVGFQVAGPPATAPPAATPSAAASPSAVTPSSTVARSAPPPPAPAPSPTAPVPQANSAAPLHPVPPPDLDDDRTLQAVKRFAEMFNGQVVEMGVDLEGLVSSPAALPIEAAHDDSAPAAGGEPDIDVPF